MTRRDTVIIGIVVLVVVALTSMFDFDHGWQHFLYIAGLGLVFHLGLLIYWNRDASPRWKAHLARPFWQRLLVIGGGMPSIIGVLYFVDWMRTGDWLPAAAAFIGTAIGGVIWVTWQAAMDGDPAPASPSQGQDSSL